MPATCRRSWPLLPPAARFVFLGSTRKFTRFPDAHGNGVLAGEAAFLASTRSGVMLHPTMIYGAQGEDNVRRLAALLARLPVVPLPGGGRSLVQPIHQDDVTRCLLAALARGWDGPHALTIAGPRALSYADFVRAVAHAAGLRVPHLIGVPADMLIAGAWLTRLALVCRGSPRPKSAACWKTKPSTRGPCNANSALPPSCWKPALRSPSPAANR